MEKINFSGGEPFLHDRGEFLGKMVQFCKQDLQLPSVSIVSNGSMIKESWFRKYGETENLPFGQFQVTSNPIHRHFRMLKLSVLIFSIRRLPGHFGHLLRQF